MNLQPVSGISLNPLVGLLPRDMQMVPAGVPIASLAPNPTGLLVCRVNGEWLLRDSWATLTRPGDVIEWHDVPQNNDNLRGVLQLVAAAAITYFTYGAGSGWISGYGAIAQAGAQVAGNLLASYAINALLPPTAIGGLSGGPQATGSALSSSLSGNQARLDQPIWKVCGRREFNPPFAAQPYFEYVAQPGASDPELDREQFYNAIFAIGIGDHDVFAKIGNTPISRFKDLTVAAYRAPGVAPTTALANVWTSGEVSAQTLESGEYVGGFQTSPKRLCTHLGIDVAAVRGLGKSSSLTVNWRVEYRQIDDFGAVLGSWAILASESRTAFTSTPQRWSNKYALPSPMRAEVRVVRTDVKDTSPAALHEIAWVGLRGYMNEAATLNPDTAHYEVVMRASAQLSGDAARDLRIVAEAKARKWSSSTGWSTPVHTRNWVWWLLDLATSSAWGLGLPDARIDLLTFEALAAQAETRQDRFDYVFDTSMDSWEAMQLIARAGRARVFRRNGVLTCARDGLADLPVTAFTPRNCQPGSMVIRWRPLRADSPDGVIVEYQDRRTWEWERITCGVPGVDDEDVANPVVIRLPGVVGAKHAEREGRYEAANLLYRTRTFELVTEMEGMLPAYMSPVKCQADIEGYGQAGDVTNWNPATLTLSLTEAPNFAAGAVQLTLVRDDGTLTTPVTVTAGAGDFDVVLPALPDFQPSYADGTRDRTKYLLSRPNGFDIVKVVSITDGGKDGEAQLFAISGLIDDDRVHEADEALLPVGDEIQDPVSDPDSGEGGGTVAFVRLDNKSFDAFSTPNAGISIELTLKTDSTLTYSASAAPTSPPLPASGTYPNEWLVFPQPPAVCALYEARFTQVSLSVTGPSNGGGISGSALGIWLQLGVANRSVIVSATGSGGTGNPSNVTAAEIFVEVREIATGIVQETATWVFNLEAISQPGS